jgi:DNA-binding XRE family transcriptional regulator
MRHLLRKVENIFWVSYPVVLCPSNKEDLGMAKPSPKHAGDHFLVLLGATIRSTRISLGLSQEALAVDAGLDRSYMGGIERGEHNLTIINLAKICSALDVNISEILIKSGN